MLLKRFGLAAFIATAAAIPPSLDDGLVSRSGINGGSSGLLRRATTPPPTDPPDEVPPLNTPNTPNTGELILPGGVRMGTRVGEFRIPQHHVERILGIEDPTKQANEFKRCQNLWEGWKRGCIERVNQRQQHDNLEPVPLDDPHLNVLCGEGANANLKGYLDSEEEMRERQPWDREAREAQALQDKAEEEMRKKREKRMLDRRRRMRPGTDKDFKFETLPAIARLSPSQVTDRLRKLPTDLNNMAADISWAGIAAAAGNAARNAGTSYKPSLAPG
ncbi:MAG: hypothetical protein M1823_006086 [Watsoniomyces obsoletus]|nr:MAG: hypothetical protein M1823_006086 [Watsoniomyces obsoletus]